MDGTSGAAPEVPAPEPFTIVVPVYNEVNALKETVDELAPIVEAHSDCVLLFVNDGSTDGSGDLLKELIAGKERMRLLEHPRNRGYGAALKTGVRHAETPLVVITDADRTYPNERIPELAEMCRDRDMVVGARTGATVQIPLIRKPAKWALTRFASWLASYPIPDLNSGLRVMRRSQVLRFLSVLPNTFSFTSSISIAMLVNDLDVLYEPIDYYRREGSSKIRPIRDTLRFTQLIFRSAMYFRPLKAFSPVVVLFLLGFLASLGYDVFVERNLTEKTLLLCLGATQLGMFSLLADMIARRSSV